MKNWFAVLFYFDHLSGRIERYAINTDSQKDLNVEWLKEYNDKNNKNLKSEILDRNFYLTFLMYFYKTAFLQSYLSYNDSNISDVSKHIQGKNNNLITREKKLYLN